ncbi:hypothetical protein AURDEDRAFT_158104 [Auricularia subglabra TFB-10046 SS5]|nr:hypothetical protein AURDEDRAFT_158104 [Auricularia subglabra TFB-10046 SS5]
MSMKLTPQAGMRLMSVCIFAYDWIITLPSEYRLYRRQKWPRISVACALFIAARYCGAAYMVSTTVLFFGKNFTPSSCKSIVPLGGFFRATVASASALTFLWRTWAIWHKNRTILIIMSVALIPHIIFSYPSAFMQIPVSNNGGCTGASGNDNVFALKWPFALVNMLYDVLACVLGTYKLILNIKSGVSSISFILLSDGLGFFFLMVVIHVLNLVFLLIPDPSRQTIMVVFYGATASILAQRIITSLSERIEVVNSSDHGSSHGRDRSKSGSRTRGGMFSKMPRPPASSYMTRSINGTEGQTKTDVEMVKIQIDVHQQVQHDDRSSLDMKDERGRTHTVSFA